MTKYFTASKLEEIVKPYDLNDILESLMDNGMIESYEFDYLNDEISITIPLGVEIKDIMAEFSAYVDPGRKRNEH